jgi:hypothetical protein
LPTASIVRDPHTGGGFTDSIWYNHDHRHNGIRYVSPAQRHVGDDRDILAARHGVYVQAKADQTRNREPITVVTLNPERDSLITAAENAAHKNL